MSAPTGSVAVAAPQPVVATPASPTQTAKDLVAEFCRRFFSEARVLARTKSYTFLAFLGFVGFGFTLRISGLGGSPTAAGMAEVILASPDAAAVVGAFAALCFVVGGNLFARAKANDYRRHLFELAVNPATSADVRIALLKELAAR